MHRLYGWIVGVFILFGPFVLLSPVFAQSASDTGMLLDQKSLSDIPSSTATETVSPIQSRYGRYERAVVTALDSETVETSRGSAVHLRYQIEIRSGSHKGKTYQFTDPLSRGANLIRPDVGDHIIVYLQEGLTPEQPTLLLDAYDRTYAYLLAFLFLLILLGLLFGLQGITTLLSLILTGILFFGFALIGYLRDWPLVLLLFTATLPSAVFFYYARPSASRYGHFAFLSTILGSFLTFFILWFSSVVTRMNPPLSKNAATLFDRSTVHPRALLLIGIAAAVFAVLAEFNRILSAGLRADASLRPLSEFSERFNVALHIARERAGLLFFPLPLAWIGASVSAFLIRYEESASTLSFFNHDAVVQTLLFPTVALIGICLSVFLSAVLLSIVWSRIPKRNTENYSDSYPSGIPSDSQGYGDA